MTAPTILSAPSVNTKYKPNKKKRDGETRRIELLGEMDDRYKELRAAGDKQGLVELASEYLVLGHGCPDTAAQILHESESL